MHSENTFSSLSVEFCQFAVHELAVNILGTEWRLEYINTPEIFPLKRKITEIHNTATGTEISGNVKTVLWKATIPSGYRAPKHSSFSVAMLLSTCFSPQICRPETKQRDCDICYLQTSTISLCFPAAPTACFSDQSLQGSPAGFPGGSGLLPCCVQASPSYHQKGSAGVICQMFLIL